MNLLLVFVSCLFLASADLPLTCYVNHPHSELYEDLGSSTECENVENACCKITEQVEVHKAETRRCCHVGACKEWKKKKHEDYEVLDCIECQTDLCNEARRPLMSGRILFLLTIFRHIL